MVVIKQRHWFWGRPKTREDYEKKKKIDMPGYTGKYRSDAETIPAKTKGK
ncbi:MAG: hypothetical protein FWH47_01255 [Methanomassiliicoccaceae archaeon]|nr:hypothetical protein [Methanomassiliicoccaceae archaeon]